MTKTQESIVTGTAAAIVTALGNGPCSALDLSQRISITHANARQSLRRLSGAGVVTKLRRGVYALPDCDMAEMRLAEEYGDAQDRGEVARHGATEGGRGNQHGNVGGPDVTTAADLGLRRDEIHDARRIGFDQAEWSRRIAEVWAHFEAMNDPRRPEAWA